MLPGVTPDSDRDELRRELRVVDEARARTVERLYGLRAGSWRSTATAAIAAAAAEETYRVIARAKDWHNDTSAEWHGHLQHVWKHLSLDTDQRFVDSQYRYLSEAIGHFLLSPLNHDDGQDGPDDFDRPQTMAAYCAALAVVTWGVEFAATAVGQVFDAIDLVHDGGMDDERWRQVQDEAAFVERITDRVVSALSDSRSADLPADVIEEIRNG